MMSSLCQQLVDGSSFDSTNGSAGEAKSEQAGKRRRVNANNDQEDIKMKKLRNTMEKANVAIERSTVLEVKTTKTNH